MLPHDKEQCSINTTNRTLRLQVTAWFVLIFVRGKVVKAMTCKQQKQFWKQCFNVTQFKFQTKSNVCLLHQADITVFFFSAKNSFFVGHTVYPETNIQFFLSFWYVLVNYKLSQYILKYKFCWNMQTLL